MFGLGCLSVPIWFLVRGGCIQPVQMWVLKLSWIWSDNLPNEASDVRDLLVIFLSASFLLALFSGDLTPVFRASSLAYSGYLSTIRLAFGSDGVPFCPGIVGLCLGSIV
ncbi:hypothetical protein YC2023_088722 [Brassica napus]|uniref:(rape) hypothetical protein n=1 Tax=Brassica napus TaxID=3708 RepID=A0A816W8J1_BRANA|nr:unnamed protein product [Brassica napus]